MIFFTLCHRLQIARYKQTEVSLVFFLEFADETVTRCGTKAQQSRWHNPGKGAVNQEHV